MSSGKGLRILVLEPDATVGQQVAMTLDAAGLDAQSCPFEGRALVEALRTFDPQLLWVRAELGSDPLGKVLATLERQGVYASLPLVLLCQDVREATFVRQMKTGVVELCSCRSLRGCTWRGCGCCHASCPSEAASCAGRARART